MRAFIFVTAEGDTFQPDSVSIAPDIENMQVLGFGAGINEEEAFRNLIDENAWLHETSFDGLVCFEFRHFDFQEHSRSFSIKSVTEPR